MTQTPIKRFHSITKALYGNKYEDLGITKMTDDSTLDNVEIQVIPHEGIHKGKEYTITCKFQECGNWPLVYIDSEIYDKIKTHQYKQNRGRVGTHKGICIKNLGYSYGFHKNFKDLCGNKWENYIYYLITVFNNLPDFGKGNGLKSNYKEILHL